MRPVINCESLVKPGKHEIIKQPIDWYKIVRTCPDCDRKRVSACKDPQCNRTKKH